MIQNNLKFLTVNLKAERINVPVCCISGQVLVDMKAVSRFLRIAWSALESDLMMAQGSWQVVTTDSTMLLPASQLADWLMQPYMQDDGQRIKLTRSNLADIWGYEFPRQVLHLFPDSTDARSHAAKLARAVRTGKAVTDPELAAGIKKSFLTIRQNRKPLERSPQVIDARNKGLLRVKDITPELVTDIHNVLRRGGFKAVAKQFTMTQNALNQIISGKFSQPCPTLDEAWTKASSQDFEF